MLDLISDRFVQSANTSAAFTDPEAYCYNNFSGAQVARASVAYFLARHFLFPSSEQLDLNKALQFVSPENITISSGAAALLGGLFYVLGEQGDACLIPAPYYAAFENDMNVVAGIIPIRIEQENPVRGPTVPEMERAYTGARAVLSQHALQPDFPPTRSNSPLLFSEDTMSSSFCSRIRIIRLEQFIGLPF